MAELILPSEGYEIMGACFEVYNQLGTGFLEAVYHEALMIEFGLRGIPFVSQPSLELTYKGQLLSQRYVPDFVCFGQVIVEIKAVSGLGDVHRAQMLNYLKGTGHRLGYLVNFSSSPRLEYERLVR